MTISPRKLVLATIVSVVMISVLLMIANVRFPDLSRAQPIWLAAVFASHLFMVALRGFALRALTPRPLRNSYLKWVHLAARHQLVFSFIPAGAGDAGFPYFAKRIAGLSAEDAVRTIAQFRIRDLIFLSLMGTTGLVLIGLPNAFTWIVIVLAIPALWLSDDIAVLALRLALALAPHSRIVEFLRTATKHERPRVVDRLIRTILATAIWSFSTIAVMSAFRAIGSPITIPEALVFIAAVNLAGAVSLSIAGLGPSEAGATAALVAAGRSLQRSSSLALVVRPLLLISIISSSLALDAVISFLASRRSELDVSTP